MLWLLTCMRVICKEVERLRGTNLRMRESFGSKPKLERDENFGEFLVSGDCVMIVFQWLSEDDEYIEFEFVTD